MKFARLLILLSFLAPVVAPAAPVPVNALNFARAETDMYFTRTVKLAGGLGKFYHIRTPTRRRTP